MKLNKTVGFLLTMFFILLLHPSLSAAQKDQFRLTGARFYYVTSADLPGNPGPEVIAVGQIQQPAKLTHQALILILDKKDGRLHPRGKLSFPLTYQGKHLPARIRAAQVFQHPLSGQWHIVSAGRGGEDEGGVGFLHLATIRSGKPVTQDQRIFSARGSAYTHGYPLAITDLEGDNHPDIIYGGFSGEARGDVADVRTYHLSGGKLREAGKLFAQLPVPLRVNAMAAANITGDHKPEVVIAGRVKKGDGREYSAFAWTGGGITFYHVFDEKRPCRLRTLLITDINGDGRNELITGGRIDIGEFWLADVRIWRIASDKAFQLARFNWGLGDKIRLRTLAPVQNRPQWLWVGGRAERRNSQGKKRWQGFIWQFSLEDNYLRPVHIPSYLDLGVETRVRHLHLTAAGTLLSCGFGKGKPDYGFVMIH